MGRRDWVGSTHKENRTSMAKKKGKMGHRHDLFDRRNLTDSNDQSYNVVAVLSRLQADSYQYFKVDSKPHKKWNKECVNLYKVITNTRHLLLKGEIDMAGLLEEFIDQFEHVERRMRQLLDHNSISEAHRQVYKNRTDSWLNAIFRFTVYATLLEAKRRRGGYEIGRESIDSSIW